MKKTFPKSKWIKGRGYTKKILLKSIKGRVKSIQTNKFSPGAIVPPHYHEKTGEIFYILKGRAIMIIDKKKIKTKPGMILECPAGKIHGVINNTKETFQILTFKLNHHGKDIYWT